MFYISMLEQDITKKKRINKFLSMSKFEIGNKKEYKIKAIRNSTIYAKKANKHLSGLYYLVA